MHFRGEIAKYTAHIQDTVSSDDNMAQPVLSSY